jgi:hypothetical protein
MLSEQVSASSQTIEKLVVGSLEAVSTQVV